jgi:hypothetical protein
VEWFELQHSPGYDEPALYHLRLVSADGQPIPIPTLLDGPDVSGIVGIGEAGDFERRRLQIISGIDRCYGHSAGELWRYLGMFTRIQEVFPGSRLQFTYRRAENKEQAETWEGEAVKEYIIRRGQLPLLNRQLPRPYDDPVWNAVYEREFGTPATTSADTDQG